MTDLTTFASKNSSTSHQRQKTYKTNTNHSRTIPLRTNTEHTTTDPLEDILKQLYKQPHAMNNHPINNGPLTNYQTDGHITLCKWSENNQIDKEVNNEQINGG